MTEVRLRGVERTFERTPVLQGVDLDVGPGECLALLGPSGCGKSTLLRLVAGLDDPDSGCIELGGRVVADPVGRVPPERRRVGLVFQDGALFPHLDVAANVGFGLERSQRRGGPRVDEVLALVGLSDLAGRDPASLSGGQAQRVALARALAPRPEVLLLDEPFSNLDAPLRHRLRAEVREVVRAAGVTTVFVTHDRDEAFLLGDRIALMRDGRIAQCDEPETVYRRPVDAWAATFLGDADLLDGEVGPTGDSVSCLLGRAPVAPRPAGRVTVVVRPEDLRLETFPPGVPPGATGATVEDERFTGSGRLTTVRSDRGPLLHCRRPIAEPPLRPGDRVTLRWLVDEATVTAPGGAAR